MLLVRSERLAGKTNALREIFLRRTSLESATTESSRAFDASSRSGLQALLKETFHGSRSRDSGFSWWNGRSFEHERTLLRLSRGRDRALAKGKEIFRRTFSRFLHASREASVKRLRWFAETICVTWVIAIVVIFSLGFIDWLIELIGVVWFFVLAVTFLGLVVRFGASSFLAWLNHEVENSSK